MSTDPIHESTRARFEEAGQGQVFRFWNELNEASKKKLVAQAEEIDLKEIQELSTMLSGDGGLHLDLEAVEPAPVLPLPTSEGGNEDLWEKAEAAGNEALEAGRVAAFTVAGGQGTRLGFDGPKGTFPVTPMSRKPLFQVFAEKIVAASRRSGRTIPWYIMTSVINHDDTVAFFEKHGHFGLDSTTVHFFQQGLMPAVDSDGKILLSEKDTIALSPDGHGGSLRALVRSGSIDRMKADGTDIISYFQVDNPMVRCIDPAFIGHHVLTGSELSSKAVPKANAAEKVGVFCLIDGKVSVVEYSDLPDELAEQTDEGGTLRFRAGSIAIHLFDRDLVARLGDPESTVSMPFHLANKKIPVVDENGETVTPDEPNGTKFEMFVFDALPFAENSIVVETSRADDFSPVKNASGVDSADTSKADQLRQFARWFAAVGIKISHNDEDIPMIPLEISPLFADSEAAFVEAWDALKEKPDPGNGIILS